MIPIDWGRSLFSLKSVLYQNNKIALKVKLITLENDFGYGYVTESFSVL